MLAAILALASCTAGAATPAHHAVPVGTVPPTLRDFRIVPVQGLAADGPADTPTPTIALPPPATPSETVAEQVAEPPVTNREPESGTSVKSEIDYSLSGAVEQWRPLVASVFPAWAVDEALYVISRESGGDPNVYNRQGSGACGLFQTLPCECLDPACNVAVAYRKWVGGGESFYAAWYQYW